MIVLLKLIENFESSIFRNLIIILISTIVFFFVFANFKLINIKILSIWMFIILFKSFIASLVDSNKEKTFFLKEKIFDHFLY